MTPSHVKDTILGVLSKARTEVYLYIRTKCMSYIGHVMTDRLRMVCQPVKIPNMTSSGHEIFKKTSITSVINIFLTNTCLIYDDFNVYTHYLKSDLPRNFWYLLFHMTSSGFEICHLTIGTKVLVLFKFWTQSLFVLMNEKLGLLYITTLSESKTNNYCIRNTYDNRRDSRYTLFLTLCYHFVPDWITVDASLEYG